MNPALRAFYEDDLTPRWAQEIIRFWGIQSQFILYGNVYDAFAFRGPGAEPNQVDEAPALLRLPHFLARLLHLVGARHLLEYDPVHGLAVHADPPFARDATLEHLERVRRVDGRLVERLRGGIAGNVQLQEIVDLVEEPPGRPERYDHLALILNFASRIAVDVAALQRGEHDQFAAAMKRSITAAPHRGPGQAPAGFDPIIWVCEKENDLPTWLYHGNPRIRRIQVSRPGPKLRRLVAPHLLAGLKPPAESTAAKLEESAALFATATEGMAINDMVAIRRLAAAEGIPAEKIAEAIRFYRVGVRRDPWQELRNEDLRLAAQRLAKAVIGQPAAIEKALSILLRAKMGLSGAQAARSASRPRGVLFFAGPTGVGKTELAKAITEIVFGEPTAYVRFDMSEFSAENADQRLLGAPPSYVGYEAGGELTNAIRARPFTVLLFDEIEKAHERLWDKFLQMLDEGFITSGQGERVYLTETLIVFTSNLGIYELNDQGKRELRVRPDTHPRYRDVDAAVREAIGRYFNLRLGRPELLNRLGENIVVFDFIRQGTGEQATAGRIFDKMLESILERVRETQGCELSLTAAVREELRAACTRDLQHGGRGIGNELEEQFINPLATALFHQNPRKGSRVEVIGYRQDPETGIASLDLGGR